MDENRDDNDNNSGKIANKPNVKRLRLQTLIQMEESPPTTSNNTTEQQDSPESPPENASASTSTSTSSPSNRVPQRRDQHYYGFSLSGSSSSSEASSNSSSSLVSDSVDNVVGEALPLRPPASDSDSEWEDIPDIPIRSMSSFVSEGYDSPTREEVETKIDSLFKKEKPKHKWFAINELDKRQLGFSSKLQSRELFQRRVYGSLHCVKRLELMCRLDEHAGCVNSLNFHPDGSLLASGSDDLKIVIWDWKIGKPLIKYKTKHRGNVFQSKFLYLSGDIHIVSCARDGQVRLAQLNREEGVRNARLLGSHRGACHRLIVLPEQPQIILSAGEDGHILSHDVRGPKSTRIIVVRDNERVVPLYSIHGHPLRSNEFCISGQDPLVRVYDQRKSTEPITDFCAFNNKQFRHHVTNAVYNHDGSEILASYSDQDIYLFDTNVPQHGKFIHQYQGHRNSATIKGVNFFGPKSEYVVSGSDCGHIYFWEKNSESLVQWLLADDSGVVNCLEPHPQLPFICTSGLDWDIKVWVPSCEEDPAMDGLMATVRTNYRAKSSTPTQADLYESQMLVMLWRHLRSSARPRTNPVFNVRDLIDPYSESDSSDTSASDLLNSDDDTDMVPNCSTS